MSIAETIYKTSLINNRRYLGNKYKLLSFITGVVNDECADIETVADIFAGTGAVSSAFVDKTLITNDLMYSNYICNYAWFGAESYDQQKIIDYVVRYNAKTNCGENYMTRNFADTYFSKKDCAKIGYIREDIERNYKKGNLNNRERAILITSLLYAMDKIAVTCGHYDAYRKGAKFEGSLELYVPLAEVNNNPKNQCFNEDANNLVKRIEADLVYIDPPYNTGSDFIYADNFAQSVDEYNEEMGVYDDYYEELKFLAGINILECLKKTRNCDDQKMVEKYIDVCFFDINNNFPEFPKCKYQILRQKNDWIYAHKNVLKFYLRVRKLWH